jgi:hypothetical protein
VKAAAVALAVAALLAACIPSVGPGDEIITAPRLLAVRNEPAEAAPGTMVTFTAFVAAPDGDAGDAGEAAAITWAFCDAPKPLTEDNVVSSACLGDGALTGIGTGPTVTAAMPGDACSHFGPDTSSSAFRPRDPDITGGYYQPLRADLVAAAGSAATSFDLARIHCDLASASAASASAFAAAYTSNQNPQLLPLRATLAASGAAVDPGALPASAQVLLQASWDPSSAETYAYYDPASQAVTTQREAMQVAWYASAGALATGSTGRSAADLQTSTTVAFTTPASAGPLHLWIVLRDSRGGVDFTEVNATVW